MIRIDAARAADLRAWCHRDDVPFAIAETISDMFADRADYKARIEELEKLAKSACFHFFCCGRENDCGKLDSSMAALAKAAGFSADPGTDEEIAQLPTPSPTDAPASDTRGLAVVDTFRGDTEHLRECMKALIQLDDAKALVPHGIGGHARDLLAAAYHRLSPSPDTASR